MRKLWRPLTYNVARLKPEVEYTDGTLVVRQPDAEGLPALRGITDFRNEWDLRLNDEVPMDLRVEMGAGTSDLQLAGLSLTGLDISLGAGISTVDLSGDWAHDLERHHRCRRGEPHRAAAQGRWRPRSWSIAVRP